VWANQELDDDDGQRACQSGVAFVVSVSAMETRKGEWAGGAWKEAARPGILRGRPVDEGTETSAGEVLGDCG
jgi:hypothetical protein